MRTAMPPPTTQSNGDQHGPGAQAVVCEHGADVLEPTNFFAELGDDRDHIDERDVDRVQEWQLA